VEEEENMEVEVEEGLSFLVVTVVAAVVVVLV